MRIETSDADTDMMLASHMAGYVVSVRSALDSPGGTTEADYWLVGASWHGTPNELCWELIPYEEEDTDMHEYLDRPRAFRPIDDTILGVY